MYAVGKRVNAGRSAACAKALVGARTKVLKPREAGSAQKVGAPAAEGTTFPAHVRALYAAIPMPTYVAMAVHRTVWPAWAW